MFVTRNRRQPRPSDPASLENGVRQALADKVCGNLLGLFLLVPEHLRLGTYDLLCGWSRATPARVEPRLALQLIHEAALCVTGLRERRNLRQRGLELANGLPFLATDMAVHDLLNAHTVAEAKTLQIALGKLRYAAGHLRGRLLIVDPHRIPSHSRRRMRRHKTAKGGKAQKVTQTFFCLDAETSQPVGFIVGTSGRTVTQATPELLELATEVCQPQAQRGLVLADSEHFSAALVDRISQETGFDLMVPAPATRHLQRRLRAIDPGHFTPRWAGYATATVPYQFVHGRQGPFFLIAQRIGERPEDYHFNAFFATCQGDEVQRLVYDYPARWHVEEFFNLDQGLGWHRAGTQNLHIRYGHMTMSLLAQALLHQLRQRLGEPFTSWDCHTMSRNLFEGLEGDLRVVDDTMLVTYYNAPYAARLSELYHNLPARLAAEGVDPRVPWLYNLKLDFRFC